MSGYRIRLTSAFRSALFEDVLTKNNLTLYQLSEKLNSGYSGLKKWRSGKTLIPEDVLRTLIGMSSDRLRDAAGEYITERLSENWGCCLGGKTFARKYTKDMNKRMDGVRSFIRSSTRLKIPSIDNDVWELFGVILGDGCLSKYFSRCQRGDVYEVLLTGNMTDDLQYYIRRIIPIIRLKFGSKADYHFRPDVHVIFIKIKSKPIFEFFKTLGVPVGKKKNKIRIPDRVFRSGDAVKAAVLRGLLDTDGHIFARKDEGYKYPYLEISSGSNKFLDDIKSLIRDFGLPAYIHGGNVLIRGGKNLKLWMEKIGSSHPVHINRYNMWLSTGILLPKRALSSAQYERAVRNGEVAGANPAGSTP